MQDFPFLTRHPPGADRLRDGIQRNAGWIRRQIRSTARGSTADEYIHWVAERLRDKVTDKMDPDEIDRLIRAEVRYLYGGSEDRTIGRRTSSDIETIEDITSLTFQRELEKSDRIQACLECLPKSYRDLVVQAYALTGKELTEAQTRNALARRLGIARNTLDHRISRALRIIRRRMMHMPSQRD